jgi:NAD(P)-dependent dehydrogenase (short-subunit alcohol dehydrogenase family)
MPRAHPGWSRAFVTGGGSGIGMTVARQLAAGGADVAIFDLRIGDAVRESLGQAAVGDGQKTGFYEVDVTDAPAVRAAVDRAVAEVGAPELVVHSAGINIAKSFHELSDDDYRRVIEVNLLGSRNTAFAVLRHMPRGGHLVLLASMGGLTPNWSYAAYSASKFGVVGLAGVLRIECRPLGIGVSVVCPPNVPTPMSVREDGRAHPVQRELKAIAGEVPLERAAELILRAARKRKFLVIPGFKAKLTYLLLKVVPLWIQHRVVNRTIDKVLKAHPEAAPDWGALSPSEPAGPSRSTRSEATDARE